MTVWSVVEPLWLDFHTEITPVTNHARNTAKPLESQGKVAVERNQLCIQIKQLMEVEKLEIDQIAERCGVAPTTVRRICRTLKLGRYSSKRQESAFLARSSQAPFGWVVAHGVLRKCPDEMKWVRIAQKMREKEQSYHAIARYFQARGVSTKNGGRWHSKTIYQILDFHSHIPAIGNLKIKGKKRK